jgi:tetratricopeptide (TPR) repeat protein
LLVGTEIKDHGIALRFETGPRTSAADAAVDASNSSSMEQSDPETTARRILETLDQGDRSPDSWGRFLLAGVAVPRLAPEVLARASALGEERPESVLPHLVGIVVAASSPDLVNPRDFTIMARRLLAAVEAEGNKGDLGRAARLVASLSMSLDPSVSLEILEGVRMLGIEDEVVLEATALSLDRIGRSDDAVLLRVRALSRVPTARTGELLRGMVRRLDDAGLGQGASVWLEEVLAQCRQGRFGSESRSMGRDVQVLLATRESVVPRNSERARERLREILRDSPAHSEALDLLVAIASGPREGAEAVTRLRAAAEAVQGDSRARFLLDASRVTLERLGLRRQATELLEAALEASPGNENVASTLDGLYRELGQDDRRLELLRSRLAWTSDPVQRSALLLDIATLAESLGEHSVAGQALGEVLEDDPTHRAALAAACRVYAAIGDSARLDRVVSSLLDLDPASIPPGLGPVEVAKPQGDPQEIDAFELESRHIREKIDSARQALDQGDAGRALALSTEILDIDPDHVVALRIAMQAAAADGRIRDAVAIGRRWSDRLYSSVERTAALLELSDLCGLDPSDPLGPGSILALAASGDPTDPRILETARRRAAEDPGEVGLTLLPTATAISHAALDLDSPARALVAARIHETALFTWDEMGDLESSVALLEVALGLDLENPALRSDLASLYEATGRLDAARALLQSDRIV